MQSHASRHVVSEFMQDLHPDLSPPFPKEIIKDEIAEAYGRRGVLKLIAVLGLYELDDEKRAHALRVFKGLLSTQEHKTEAINEGASKPLTHLVVVTHHVEVRKLSCECLGSMAQILPGRNAIVKAKGFQALTEALKSSPEAAAGALKEFSKSNDGVALLNTVLSLVVPALVELIINDAADADISIKACENAAATLSGIATTDAGICSCLEFKVPACMVKLINRGLTGKFKFEPELMECMGEAASCMEQVCHHPYGKTQAREADAIKAISGLMGLGRWHALTVSKCSSALMGVSIEKESKVAVVEFAGVELVRMLKGEDPELEGNARSALQNACEHLTARKMMANFMSEEELKKVLYQGKALPPTPPDFRFTVTLPAAKGRV